MQAAARAPVRMCTGGKPERALAPADEGRLKDKFVMVAGVGAGKVAPLLFGLFLSRRFGAASFADFVVVLSYVAALSAVPTLGSAPQIVRAGAQAEPEASVVMAGLCSLVVMAAGLVLSAAYWLGLAPHALWRGGALAGQGAVALLSLGLVLYSLAQATCSLQGRYRAVGLWSLGIYAGAALAGGLAGRAGGETGALWGYFTVFLLGALGFFGVSQAPLRAVWRQQLQRLSPGAIGRGLRQALATSLFGVITLAGIFLLMKSVQLRLPSAESAVFALGFQLFQAGIFLPSVLGAVVVPRLVAAQRAGTDAMALHRRTRRLYLGLGLGWLLLVAGAGRPLLRLYGLDQSGWPAVLLMQLAAVLAGLQAYFIQRLVALGRFRLLALGSLLWAGLALGLLALQDGGARWAAMAMVLAYGASLLFYRAVGSGPEGAGAGAAGP